MTNLFTWCLAGALAASLAWNVRGLTRTEGAPAGQNADLCSPGECDLELLKLDLTPEQVRAFEQWNGTACAPSEDFEAKASRRSEDLFQMLGSTDLDPERARALADEVGSLRAQALRNCVDSIVEVRRHLTPEQVALLLKMCCQKGHH